MITGLLAYLLINLASSLPIKSYPTVEECVEASYHVSFVTGQETRCEPVRGVVQHDDN